LLAAFPGVESGLFTARYPVVVVLLLGLVAVYVYFTFRSQG
jgi:cytochrome bd-type quinol oxidase subunit 2